MEGGRNMVPKMNHFYIKMDASFMYTMNIPNKFVKIFKGSISENIKLEGPSGITWHVKMIKSNGTFVLQSGWKNFVSANKIDKNDIVFFTYNGNSFFKVVIFDPSGCEKAAPFFAKKMEMELEDSNDSSIQIVVTPHYNVSCNRSARDLKGDFEAIKKCKRSDPCPVRKTREKKVAWENSRLYIVPRRTNLTKAQEKIANEMARTTQAGSELFVKILTSMNIHTNKYCALNFPSGFACEVFESKKQMITLLPADLNKSKGCIAKYCKKKRMRGITKGWKNFVRKNRLKKGDLCLFELRKQEIRKKLVLTMVVHSYYQ